MSVKAMTWVFEHSRAKLADRLVLLAIADHADDLGLNAWPSVARLADKACVSERQVQVSLASLTALGELRVRRGGGRKRTNIYELTRIGQQPLPLERVQNLHPRRICTGAESAPRRIRSKRVNTCSPESSLTIPTPPPANAGSPPLPDGPTDDLHPFLEIWNRDCGPLPTARSLTKGRRAKLRSRFQAGPEFARDFPAAVKEAGATPFLCGENERGWLCNFDWLIANDTNWVRVLEGTYRKGPGVTRSDTGVGRLDPHAKRFCDEPGCRVEVDPGETFCESCKPKIIARLRRAGIDPGPRLQAHEAVLETDPPSTSEATK